MGGAQHGGDTRTTGAVLRAGHLPHLPQQADGHGQHLEQVWMIETVWISRMRRDLVDGAQSV